MDAEAAELGSDCSQGIQLSLDAEMREKRFATLSIKWRLLIALLFNLTKPDNSTRLLLC